MDNKKVGKLIADLRKKNGLTQQELGDKVGVGFRAVSKWERGITLPDITIINELSKILGISSNELLDGKVTKEIKTKPKISKKLKIVLSISISIIASDVQTAVIWVTSSMFSSSAIANGANPIVNWVDEEGWPSALYPSAASKYSVSLLIR